MATPVIALAKTPPMVSHEPKRPQIQLKTALSIKTIVIRKKRNQSTILALFVGKAYLALIRL